MSKVLLGKNKANPKELVEWDTEKTINFHWLIVGASGSGKTYQIRSIIKQLQNQGISRIHIFDPHRDVFTDKQYTSSVKFSETSPYGINPLRINPDPYYGGVRRRINSLISMINRYSTRLDYKQEAALRYLLRELYESSGYDFSIPETWASGNVPDLFSLRDYAYNKLKGFFIGHMHEVSNLLDLLGNKLLHLKRQLGVRKEEVAELKREVKNLFSDYIDAMSEGDGIDQYIRYDFREVLKSIYDRIENLQALGVFKPLPPPFESDKPIWHYDISTLYVEEQGYLIELSLEQIFIEATQRGFKDNLDTLIIVDETQRFIDPNERDHIITVISREARKFGVGLVLASQNCSNFTEDIILNSGTKIILGVDESYQSSLARTFGIDENRIRFTQPRKSALIQIKTKEISSTNRFMEIVF
jgi:DNA helicase HerA-like ATPase